jgi:peptidoglycan/xylan/chitin deacetylase (PgdA/CDA1 family)
MQVDQGRGQATTATPVSTSKRALYVSDCRHPEQSRGWATFFQVGWCVERSPETAAALAAAGHVIGNHSLSHRFRIYLQPGAFTREIEQTQQILKQTLGKEPLLVRTPWLWRQPAILSMFRRRKLTPVSGLFCHALEVFQIDAARIA